MSVIWNILQEIVFPCKWRWCFNNSTQAWWLNRTASSSGENPHLQCKIKINSTMNIMPLTFISAHNWYELGLHFLNNNNNKYKNFHLTPEVEITMLRSKNKNDRVLATRNNLRVKNARQQVQRKYILHG